MSIFANIDLLDNCWHKIANVVLMRRRIMISAPPQADNDNDWAAGAPLLLARFGDGTLDLCRSGGGARSFGISRDQDLHLRALQLSFDQLKRHSAGLGLQFEFICSLDFACRSPDWEKLQ